MEHTWQCSSRETGAGSIPMSRNLNPLPARDAGRLMCLPVSAFPVVVSLSTTLSPHTCLAGSHYDYFCSYRIGKSRGYKSGELDKFGEGQTLLVGGKEVEVYSLTILKTMMLRTLF